VLQEAGFDGTELLEVNLRLAGYHQAIRMVVRPWVGPHYLRWYEVGRYMPANLLWLDVAITKQVVGV
jgi:hypothetical protein